jgi:acetolactate synthase-1/2/3 large subunit
VEPSAEAVASTRALLDAAERPLVVVGGTPWSTEAHDALTAWCTASSLPVAVGWRRQDHVDNRAPVFAGHLTLGADPRLTQRVREADVLLAIGERLSEITSGGYTSLGIPVPSQRLVHVSADPDELGRVYEPALAVPASPDAFALALAATPPLDPGPRRERADAANADYRDYLRHGAAPGSLNMGDVMETLRARLTPDAILTNGAGNFSVWTHRFYEFGRFPTQLAPTSGAMGYGVPAAVAAKLLHPDRHVVAMAGDGDFLMTGQELATAVQHGAAIVVLVVNNGMYGTIRMHQERSYPGRVSGTDLVNPDFAALARSFGAHGAIVERTEEFASAFDEALAAGRPALIELRVDPEALTPRQSLTEIREQALARRAAS